MICPMVEESEGLEAENVTDYTQLLKKELPGITVEMLHGQMKAAQKNEIMERFASGEIQVLVSTTVVEVGVNVPNATVMMGKCRTVRPCTAPSAPRTCRKRRASVLLYFHPRKQRSGDRQTSGNPEPFERRVLYCLGRFETARQRRSAGNAPERGYGIPDGRYFPGCRYPAESE